MAQKTKVTGRRAARRQRVKPLTTSEPALLEIVRASVNKDDGMTVVDVSGPARSFLGPERSERLAQEIAEAVTRALGVEIAVREFRLLNQS
jgi:hypothetical protein